MPLGGLGQRFRQIEIQADLDLRQPKNMRTRRQNNLKFRKEVCNHGGLQQTRLHEDYRITDPLLADPIKGNLELTSTAVAL